MVLRLNDLAELHLQAGGLQRTNPRPLGACGGCTKGRNRACISFSRAIHTRSDNGTEAEAPLALGEARESLMHFVFPLHERTAEGVAGALDLCEHHLRRRLLPPQQEVGHAPCKRER